MEFSPSSGRVKKKRFASWLAPTLFLFFSLISLTAFAQKGGGNGVKDFVIRACTEEIGNGLYQASFSYENPNKKEVIVGEEESFVKSSKGKKSKGPKAFKPGKVNKAFTKEFSEGESVEWTVINPNGNTHTVIASANSSHCPCLLYTSDAADDYFWV